MVILSWCVDTQCIINICKMIVFHLCDMMVSSSYVPASHTEDTHRAADSTLGLKKQLDRVV